MKNTGWLYWLGGLAGMALGLLVGILGIGWHPGVGFAHVLGSTWFFIFGAMYVGLLFGSCIGDHYDGVLWGKRHPEKIPEQTPNPPT